MSTENNSCAPRLRFPGFTGDWKEIVFGDVAGINRGGSPRPIGKYLTTDPKGVNWIKIGDVEADAKYISHAEERIIPEGVSYSRKVRSGDFLLSNSMSFGRPYILKIDGCIHDGWLVIQDYQDTFDKEFLYYLLSSDSVLKQYQSFAAGSSVLNLNKEIVAKVRLYIPPSFAEQKKIAECLSEIDSLIIAQSENIDALKEKKTGLMQQLFPQDGETVPRMRFPDFEGEWEEHRLGEYFKLLNGYAFKSDTYVEDGFYKIITIANVQNGVLDLTKYNSVKQIPSNIAEHQILKMGDIILSMTGNVGRVCIVTQPNCLLNQRVGLLKPVNYQVDSNYIYCLINSDHFENTMIRSGQGAAQANISKDNVESFSILVPPTIAEQKKIAECLSALDDQIAAETAKLDALQDHKKGLMQQLFPQPAR